MKFSRRSALLAVLVIAIYALAVTIAFHRSERRPVDAPATFLPF